MSGKNFVFAVTPTYKEPNGSSYGDPCAWFRAYKFDVEGSTNVRINPEDMPGVEAGDCLWFIVDNMVLGRVRLTAVQQDMPWRPELLELWYEGESIDRLEPPVPFARAEHGPVGEEEMRDLICHIVLLKDCHE